MTVFFKKIFSIFVWFYSKFYTYKTSQYLHVIRDTFYTMWLSNFVGGIGEHSIIQFPLSIQGGGANRIRIGNHTSVQSHSILGCWLSYSSYEGVQFFEPEILIGDHCSIGEYNQITACNKIIIGDGLLTGRYVFIGDNAHGGLSAEEAETPPVKRKLISKGKIIIGKNVWIGDKVSILGGVTIGDNAIIGSNSVVTHDVPSNCVIAGAPAVILKSI